MKKKKNLVLVDSTLESKLRGMTPDQVMTKISDDIIVPITSSEYNIIYRIQELLSRLKINIPIYDISVNDDISKCTIKFTDDITLTSDLHTNLNSGIEINEFKYSLIAMINRDKNFKFDLLSVVSKVYEYFKVYEWPDYIGKFYSIKIKQLSDARIKFLFRTGVSFELDKSDLKLRCDYKIDRKEFRDMLISRLRTHIDMYSSTIKTNKDLIKQSKIVINNLPIDVMLSDDVIYYNEFLWRDPNIQIKLHMMVDIIIRPSSDGGFDIY